MAWTLRIQQVIPGLGNKIPTLINYSFTSPRLLVKCEAADALSTWYKAGWLSQVINLPGIGEFVEVKSFIAPLGEKLFEVAPEPEYQLRFEPVHYLNSVTITIWENV